MKARSLFRFNYPMLIAVTLLIFQGFELKAQSALHQLEIAAGRKIDMSNTTSSSYRNSSRANTYSASYFRRLKVANKYNEEAITYMRTNNYKKAIASLKKALWYDPFNKTVKANLAKVKEIMHGKSNNQTAHTNRPKPNPDYSDSESGSSDGNISTHKPVPPTVTTHKPDPNQTITTLDGRTRRLKFSYDYTAMTTMQPNKGINDNITPQHKLSDYREFKIVTYGISKISDMPGGKVPAMVGSFMLNVVDNTFSAVQNATDAMVRGNVTESDLHQLNVKVIINKSLSDIAIDQAVGTAQKPITNAGIGMLDKRYGKTSKTYSKMGLGAVQDAKNLYEIYKAPSTNNKK